MLRGPRIARSILTGLRLPALRAFSTANSSRKLVKVLDKEVEYESSNYQVDESVAVTYMQPYLQESGFTLDDSDDSIEVKLTKRVDNYEVEVTFQARAPDTEQEEEQQQEEQAKEPSTYAEFQVLIRKTGSRKGLIYECTSVDSELNVNNIVYHEDINSIERVTTFGNKHEYRGPDFPTLDEKVQNALLEYLKAFGVSEDLAIFVETYSADKEQRLYIDWLQKLKNFVS